MLRPDTTLTGSYVAGNVLRVMDYEQANIYVKYTKGDETSMELKIEFTTDQTNWFQEVGLTTTTGKATVVPLYYQFIASGNYRLQIPTTDEDMRISVKATGGSPTGKVMIDSYLGME